MSEPTRPAIATASQTIGPFFHCGPGHDCVPLITSASVPGSPLRLVISVTDGEGQPISDALVEVWHADATGKYPARQPGEPPGAFTGFGRQPTDEVGTCVFDTIVPGPTAPGHAAHVNVCLFMRGLLRHVYTRCYFSGDRDLGTDPVLERVPPERRETLLAERRSGSGDTWVFHIRLQGQEETAFFDL